MNKRVLSLDTAAAKTGWAFSAGRKIHYGIIKTSPKMPMAKRLVHFRKEIENLLFKLKPTHIVMEDVFSGLNVKTMKILAKFAGVAEECCMELLKVEPYIISTTTVKSYLKAKKKEDVFHAVISILEWQEEEFTFKEHNDIMDAIGQLLCYIDQVLEYKRIRQETEYGYLYEVYNGKYKVISNKN